MFLVSMWPLKEVKLNAAWWSVIDSYTINYCFNPSKAYTQIDIAVFFFTDRTPVRCGRSSCNQPAIGHIFCYRHGGWPMLYPWELWKVEE
jgi:hypothetical protein